MYAEEMPGNCGLAIVTSVQDLLSQDNEYAERGRARLNTSYQHAGPQGAILTITNDDKPAYAKAKAFLLKQGWKLLGSTPGNHQYPGFRYRSYLWGSPEFRREDADLGTKSSRRTRSRAKRTASKY